MNQQLEQYFEGEEDLSNIEFTKSMILLQKNFISAFLDAPESLKPTFVRNVGKYYGLKLEIEEISTIIRWLKYDNSFKFGQITDIMKLPKMEI